MLRCGRVAVKDRQGMSARGPEWRHDVVMVMGEPRCHGVPPAEIRPDRVLRHPWQRIARFLCGWLDGSGVGRPSDRPSSGLGD